LLTSGYDRAYGARPLKRAIQRLIQDPLALKILDGEIMTGDRVVIDADPRNKRLHFEVAERGGEIRITILNGTINNSKMK